MPADLDTIKALLTRVSAATGPDRSLDRALWLAFGPGNRPVGPYTASIDAAVTLAELENPGDGTGHLMRARDGWDGEYIDASDLTSILARGTIAALLKALIAQQEDCTHG